MATAESHEQRSSVGSSQSVAQLFRMRVAADGQRTAARRKVKGAWQDVSWSQLSQEAEEAAWGLLALGVKKGEMVSILAGTRLGPILMWTLFAGLVGLIIKTIEQRLSLVGRIIARLLGTAWSVAPCCS